MLVGVDLVNMNVEREPTIVETYCSRLGGPGSASGRRIGWAGFRASSQSTRGGFGSRGGVEPQRQRVHGVKSWRQTKSDWTQEDRGFERQVAQKKSLNECEGLEGTSAMVEALASAARGEMESILIG